MRIRCVGPILGNGKKIKSLLENYENIEFKKQVDSLNDLNLNDVYCSAAFYDTNISGINAVTASNRMFKLLSFGIPLIYPKLPNLINAPDNVIKQCDSVSDFVNSFKFFSENFYLIQHDIKLFLKGNYKIDRKDQLKKFLNYLN